MKKIVLLVFIILSYSVAAEIALDIEFKSNGKITLRQTVKVPLGKVERLTVPQSNNIVEIKVTDKSGFSSTQKGDNSYEFLSEMVLIEMKILEKDGLGEKIVSSPKVITILNHEVKLEVEEQDTNNLPKLSLTLLPRKI
jgi:hypothetical protein